MSGFAGLTACQEPKSSSGSGAGGGSVGADDASTANDTSNVPAAMEDSRSSNDTYEDDFGYNVAAGFRISDVHDDEETSPVADKESHRGRDFKTPKNPHDTLLGHAKQHSSSNFTPALLQVNDVASTVTPAMQLAPKNNLYKSLGTANRTKDKICQTYTHCIKHCSQGVSVVPPGQVCAVVPPTPGSAVTEASNNHPTNRYQVKLSDGTPGYHHSLEDEDSYGYHQAKFLNKISETEDLQEKNTSKVLDMEYAFAPHFSTILQHHSDFLDLLNTAEAVETMADETIQSFIRSFENWQ